MPAFRLPRGLRDPGRVQAFRRRLLAWFRRVGRPLPWRDTRDPYRIAVSEFMLQQTQVSRVEQFYPRFLAQYPTLESLARARPRAVREAWDGLGYYRRAANLHRLAQVVVKEHRGVMPSDPAVLATLPGVGRYTAGAIATFAYERPVAAVDTNVGRVLRRVFAPTLSAGSRGGSGLWRLAEAVVPRRGRTAWAFNQALMDLGATICTARAPRCPACPVRATCRTWKRRPASRRDRA